MPRNFDLAHKGPPMRSSFLCLAFALSVSVLPAQESSPSAKATEGAATPRKMEGVNADLVAARKATAEKRFADSEALMAPVTQSNPALILPWVELGLAQMGLKKYTEAEISFKKALGIDVVSAAQAHQDDFYQTDNSPTKVAPTAMRANRNATGGTVFSGENRTPDVQGVSWASLGEIYAQQKKFPEATAAFDSAVKAFPTGAAQYRHNETVAFFSAGYADGQVTAATQAIALDPARAANYYFKGQGLVGKATVDPKTQKIILPPDCGESYQKYLDLEPNGPFSADAKAVLASAGLSLKSGKK